MFSTEMALLHQRFRGIEDNLSKIDLSKTSIISDYFQLVLEDLRIELSEINDAMNQASIMEKATASNKSRYYSSLSTKIGTLRTLMTAVDRDLPISKLVLNQSHLPEYHRLDGMVKECLGGCNPEWILCMWDEFKCLLPRQSLKSSLPAFTFIIYPESAVQTALIYPILFHEVGHSALLTSTSNTSFANLGVALDELDKQYIFRASNAGGGSKIKVISEWDMKRSWDMWSRELFCDYYALLAAGPAYLHAMLTYLSGTYPYDIGPTHPPIQLRLDFMMLMSKRMGIDDVGFDRNRAKWDRLKAVCSYQEIPKYRIVNDPTFIDALIEDVQAITTDMGVDKRNYWTFSDRGSTAIGLINSAWEKVLNGELNAYQANEWVISHISSD